MQSNQLLKKIFKYSIEKYVTKDSKIFDKPNIQK